jgi:hypothetical protein
VLWSRIAVQIIGLLAHSLVHEIINPCRDAWRMPVAHAVSRRSIHRKQEPGVVIADIRRSFGVFVSVESLA